MDNQNIVRHAKGRVIGCVRQNEYCRRYKDDDLFAKCPACGEILDMTDVPQHESKCKASRKQKQLVWIGVA